MPLPYKRPEFIYQRMERDPVFRAEMHRAMGCCEDGNCKQKTAPAVDMSDFSEE